MNVLVVTGQGLTGISYHRQIVPHNHLVRTYGYTVTYVKSLSEASDEQLKEYSIVSVSRDLGREDNIKEQFDRVKSAGGKVIVDTDDYWVLHSTHNLRYRYWDKAKNKFNVDEYSKPHIECLVNADYVTTTTELLADKIRQYNTNVVVLPNSIDPEEPQYKIEDKQTDVTRIGWVGGVHHQQDLSLMVNGFNELWKSSLSFQLCLCGWNYYNLDIENKKAYVLEQLKNEMHRDLRGIFTNMLNALNRGEDVGWQYIWNMNYNNEYTWHTYEKMFTINYKYISDKYREYLFKQTNEGNDKWSGEKYRRVLAKSVNDYCSLYNEIDVALVPLVENNFNSFKSPLKIIEAGYFKKPVIVSNVKPYSLDCNRQNSILVNPSKRNEGWDVAIKSLILNPDKGEDLAERLHELVLSKYMIDIVNKERHEFYQSI